jgi:hypothetical protein
MYYVLFILSDCPICWSSLHLIYGDGILCVHFDDKPFLALCPEPLIYNLCLEVIYLPSIFKIEWNFRDAGCCAHPSNLRYPYLLGLEWNTSWLLPLHG